jgi:hypothetical protein
VDESLVAHSDLTQLDGEPTSRATPHIERTPVGGAAGEAAATLMVVALAAMTAMACVAGIGIWIKATTSLIMICSVLVFAFVLHAGVSLIRRS